MIKIAFARLGSPVPSTEDALRRLGHLYERAVAEAAEVVVVPEVELPITKEARRAGLQRTLSGSDLECLGASIGQSPLLLGGCSRHRSVPSAVLLRNGRVHQLGQIAPGTFILRFAEQVIEMLILNNSWAGDEPSPSCCRTKHLSSMGATIALNFHERLAVTAETIGQSTASVYWHLLRDGSTPVANSGLIRNNQASFVNPSLQDQIQIVNLDDHWNEIAGVSTDKNFAVALGYTTELPLSVGQQTLFTEVQRTHRQYYTGMMFRSQMGESEAMLFVHPRPRRSAFHMQNTHIPLSCAYMDASGVIQEIYELHPHDETISYSRSSRIQFILEVRQGWLEAHNVGVGTQITVGERALGEVLFRAGA